MQKDLFLDNLSKLIKLEVRAFDIRRLQIFEETTIFALFWFIVLNIRIKYTCMSHSKCDYRFQ